MTNEDKIVEVFLKISDYHLNRYTELPLPIQEKLKEKFLLISDAKNINAQTTAFGVNPTHNKPD
jgi:hypothetical protein